MLCFSIATLYGVIKRLLSPAFASTFEERRELREAVNMRLAEDRIDYYYNRAVQYFFGLADLNNRLKEYLDAGPASGIASMARDPEVRDVLFRPVGQIAFANAIAAIAKAKGMEIALNTASKFPIDMVRTTICQGDLGHRTQKDDRKRRTSSRPSS